MKTLETPLTLCPAARKSWVVIAIILITLRVFYPAAAGERPVITGQFEIGARAGALIAHELSATGHPEYFSAAGLPAGITIDPATGILSGVTRVEPETYDTLVSATNSFGASLPESIKIHVYPEDGEPPMISGDIAASAPAGEPVKFNYEIAHMDAVAVVEVEGLPNGLVFDHTWLDPFAFTPDTAPSERVFDLQIEGTISTPGLYPFIVRATNLYGTTERTFYLSANSTIWQKTEPFADDIVSLAYGNGRFAALIASGEIHTSEDGSEWALGLAEGSGVPIRILFANDRFIALGNERRSGPGEIYTSPDGVNWTASESLFGVEWLNAAYGNGRYVVAGGRHTTNVPAVAVSENGETWSFSEPESFPGRILGMVFDGSHFIAIGPYGEVGRSTDGLEWSLIGRTFISNFQQLAFGNGRFVAVDRTRETYVSEDGVTWTRSEADMGSHMTMTIEFVQDRFLLGGVGGVIKESFDGVRWADRTPHGSDLPAVRGFAFDGDTLIAGAHHGRAFISGNPVAWPPAVFERSFRTLRSGETSEFEVPITGDFDRVYGFGLPPGLSLDETDAVVAGIPSEVGDFTVTVIPEDSGEPGLPEELVIRVRPENGDPPKITMPRTLMLDPGERVFQVIETEGLDPDSTFELLDLPDDVSAEILPDVMGWHALERSAGVYTARAENVYGATETEVLIVAESQHETEWRLVEDVIPSAGSSARLDGIIHAEGRFVAVGRAQLSAVATVSEDGENWTHTFIDGSERLKDVAYGHGRLIAVGHGGEIFSSADGLEWVKRADLVADVGFEGTLETVTFNGEMFLAAGSNGIVVVSENGIDWEIRDSGVSDYLYDLSSGEGRFVALRGSWTNPIVFLSDDALNWYSAPDSGHLRSLRNVVYGNGRFVATGAVSIDGAHWLSDLRYHEWGVSSSTSRRVAFHDGYFVSTGFGRIAYSVDGFIWGARTQNVSGSFEGIASDGEKTVAVLDRSDVFVKEPGLPVLIGPGNHLVSDGMPYEFDPIYGDATRSAIRIASVGEPLELPMITFGQPDSFLAAGLPAGLTLDQISGTLTGIPEDAGVYDIGIGATHESGFSEPILIQLHVRPPSGAPPRLTSADTLATQRWSEFLYEITIEGADPATDIVAVELPRGLRLDPLRRTISGELLDGGAQPIVLTLSNSHGSRTETIFVESFTPDMQRRVSGVEAHLNDVAYGAGVFVAVGNGSIILTSQDGDEWIPRESPLADLDRDNDLLGIVYGPAGFLALTDHSSHRVIASPDGIEWEIATSDHLVSQAGHITSGNGIYVMGGGNGRIFTSVNGTDWTERETPVTDTINNLSFAGGHFLVSLPFQRFLASTDGLGWEVLEDLEGILGTLSHVTYGKGRFVGVRPAMRMLFSGENIDQWKRLPDPPTELVDAVFADEQFLAVGGFSDEGIVSTSPDGWLWHERTVADPLQAVAAGGGRFVGVGRNGRIGVTDGLWAPVIMDPPYVFGQTGVEFQHKISTGYEPDFYSAEGLPQGIDLDESLGRFYGSPEEAGTFAVTVIAVNSTGASDPFELTFVIYPDDGEPPVAEEALTPQIVDLGHEYEYRIPFDIDSAPTRISVEGLPAGLAFEPDTGTISGTPTQTGTFDLLVRAENFFGQTEIETILQVFSRPMTALESPVDDDLYGLAYGNGVYIAVGRLQVWGEPNSVLRSTNGVDWTVQLIPVSSDGQLRDVVYGGGRFVAVGDAGAIFVSENGIDWSAATSILDSDPVLYAVAYGGGTFVAVGNGGDVFASEDGQLWDAVDSPTDEDLRAVALYGDRIVIAGRNGTLFTSEDMIEWTKHNSFLRDGGIGLFGGTLMGAFADAERFLVMSSGGIFRSFHDEDKWRRVHESVGGNTLYSATYTGAEFRAVGAGGTVVVSFDGEDWRDVSHEAGTRPDPSWSGTTPRLDAIVTGNGLVVTAGRSGTLFAGLPRWQPHFTGETAVVARAGGSFEYVIETDQTLDIATARNLPSGFEFDTETGVISGVYTETGTWVLEVAGSNEFGWTGWIEVEVEVLPSTGPLPRLASSEFLSGTVATPLEYQMLVEHSDLTTEVFIEGIPDGLEYYPGDRILSGTLEESGAFVMNVNMSNVYGNSSQEIELFIATPDWERIEIPGSETLTGVAFGNGRYVASGTSGGIFHSVDGTDWEEAPTSINEDSLWDLRFLNTAFYAVGNNGIMLASEFGTEWTVRDTGISEALTGIAFGNGTYVGVRFDGFVIHSDDGLNWNSEMVPDANSFETIAFGPPGFVASESFFGSFHFSADAATWESYFRPFQIDYLNDFTHVQDRFWGVGKGRDGGVLVSSVDGKIWEVSPASFPNGLQGIAYHDSLLIVVGENGMTALSEDTNEWTPLVSGSDVTLNAVTPGDAGFVAVGGNGTILRLPIPLRPSIVPVSPVFGKVGTEFSYSIMASGIVTEFKAVGLPEGLTVDPANGLISGTPEKFGTYFVRIEAENESGHGVDTLELEIAGATPVILEQPQPITAEIGDSVTFTVTGDGEPKPQFQWLKDGMTLSDGGSLDGVNSPTLMIPNAELSDSGSYTVVLSNTYGQTESKTARLRVGRSYDTWTEYHGIPVNLRAPEDDPTGAGIPNLLAYFFGADPLAQSHGHRVHKETDEDTITFTFTRSKAAIDVQWEIQVSEDLQTWRVPGIPPVLTDETITDEQWQLTKPINKSPMFVRILVNQ